MVSVINLLHTVERLRGPGGCPWDQEQTHQSLCNCLVEECAELLDAIDREDFPHMREELGDLLLQVVMHAQLAAEFGHFNFEDVAAEINEKLIRRHPHVFGDVDLKDTEAVLESWEKIKAQEKLAKGQVQMGLFKDLPAQLPALLYARDVYKQIKKKSLANEQTINENKVNEIADGLDEEQAGRMLFEITAACRESGLDPESALRRYTSNMVNKIELVANN